MTFYDLMKYAKTGIASADMSMYDKQKALAMFGGGGGSWPNTYVEGSLPLSFLSDGRQISTWGLVGTMTQTETPTTSNPIYPSEVGDIVESGEHAGSYAIPIMCGSTTFIAYLNEPIRGIGEFYTDAISKIAEFSISGVSRRIRKIVLNGDEDFLRYTSTNPRAYLEITGATIEDGKVSVMCSHYQARPNGSLTTVVGYPSGSIAWRTALNQLTIMDSNIQSLDDFKSFLAQEYSNGTPVTVWYTAQQVQNEIIDFPDIRPVNGLNQLVVGTTLQPQSALLYGGIKEN